MQCQHFLFLWYLIVCPSAAQAPPLLDALRSSGATQYAASIASDPVASALYFSNQVQTVFAPSDQTYSLKWKRSPADEQKMALQASGSLNNLADLNKPPAGATVPTTDTTANVGGTSQKVVSDPRAIPQSNITRRDSAFSRREINGTLPAIFSGLGNSVNIIKGDIPYDGGLIHIVDGPFTLPTTLSSTTAQTGHTTFTALTTASNLTSELDSVANFTALVPTNAAFDNAKVSATDPTTPSLMDGHIIPKFAGYLPYLTNGLKLVTQAGTTVTVTVEGSDFYLNNAKIIASNLVLENGVAHVLDQVLSFAPNATPAAPAPTTTTVSFTGAASSSIHGDRGVCSSLILAAVLILTFI